MLPGNIDNHSARSLTNELHQDHASNQRSRLVAKVSQTNNIPESTPAHLERKLAAYDKILDSNLGNHLNNSEVADIHWNKSCSHTKMSEYYINGDVNNGQKQPIQAHTQLELAHDCMQEAKKLYSNAGDISLCDSEMDNIKRNRDLIIGHLERAAAALPDLHYSANLPPQR